MPKPNRSGLETELIMGIGPKKARELEERFGVTTVASLRKRRDAQEILSQDAIRCLKYCPWPPRRYSREQIRRLFRQFMSEFRKLNTAPPRVELVGSYRRGKKDSGDIDMMITLPLHSQDMDEMREYFKTLKFPRSIKWITTKISERISFVYRDAKFDMFLATIDNYYEALVHWTGGEQENIIMRMHAKQQGMKFSQRGLYRGKDRIHVRSEKDIYEQIGIEYRSPVQRR